jgi:hypothetical protein
MTTNPITADSRRTAVRRRAEPRRIPFRRKFARTVPWVFGFSVALALFVAYRLRHLDLITAESGPGYWFGIGGATLMGLLLIYPLRKRIRGLSVIGGTRFWFNTHMMFGILGPALILLHCNFRLGSTNSNVALVSMLIVAGSGLIGRFIYVRIHQGLSERKLNFAELRKDLVQSRDEVSDLYALAPSVKAILQSYSERILGPRANLLTSLLKLPTRHLDGTMTGLRARSLAKREVRANASAAGLNHREARQVTKQIRGDIRSFVSNARRVANFSFYERLFSLWHVAHIPLFIALVAAATFHVIAVHRY